MLRFAFLVPLVFLAWVTRAQNTVPAKPTTQPTGTDKGFIGIFIGPAIPVGSFGSKNFTDSTAGYAKAGFLIGASVNYYFTDALGITGMFNSFSNNVDAASIAKQASAKYSTYKWTVTADNWNVKDFMVGPSLKLPLEGAQLNLSLLFGFAGATSPEMFLTGSQGSISNTGKINSSSSGAGCIMLNATARIDISPQICFTLGGGYFHTRPLFMNVTTNFTNGTATVSNFYQDISVLMFSAGLGYRFTKKS